MAQALDEPGRVIAGDELADDPLRQGPGVTTTSESVRERLAHWRLQDVLLKYPDLRFAPATRGWVKLAGNLAFSAAVSDKERIDDEYLVEVSVPDNFPTRVPSVQETGGRIPSSFHKLDNGALCLGSPARLRLILLESPSLLHFVERCVVPYLYGYSYFEKHGALPFGELKHGAAGIRQDFANIFGIDQEDVVDGLVRLASMGKRHANKQPCPCGSRRRLGRCHHRRVNSLRGRLGRQWFRSWYATLSHNIGGRLRYGDASATPTVEGTNASRWSSPGEALHSDGSNSWVKSG